MTHHVFVGRFRADILLRHLATAGVTWVACLAMSGCGGDDGAAPLARGQTPSSAGAPAPGDGAVAGEVPIVAAPTPGPSAASGTTAIPAPLPNSRLDCSP